MLDLSNSAPFRPLPCPCLSLVVVGWDTPFPLVYEPLYLPTARRVADAIRKVARA